MRRVVPIRADDERLEAASRWVVRIDEGLSAEDETALRRWLDEHPENPAELLEVARAWDKLACLSRLADLFPIEPPAAGARPARPARRPLAAWLTATACTAALAGAAWLLGPTWDAASPSTEEAAARHPVNWETAVGERRTVQLADASIVTLNTDSRIRAAFSDAERSLELLQGEIHVQVARDPARPFTVIAGDRVVQAVGTAFAVSLTATRELELVVTEGRVAVGRRSPATAGQAPGPPSDAASAGPRIVAAGEELVVRSAEEIVVPVSPEALEARLAWREGRLIFRDEPLAKAIAEIERYTTVDFVFVDESLERQSISGRYKTGDVDALLLALRANFGIDYEYDGDRRVLLRRL